MIIQLSNPINCNRSAAKISKVMGSTKYLTTAGRSRYWSITWYGKGTDFILQENRSLQTAHRGVTLCRGTLLCGWSAETYFPASVNQGLAINATSVLFWVPWWYKYLRWLQCSWWLLIICETHSDNCCLGDQEWQLAEMCPGAAWANWATSSQLEGSWRVTDGASAESRACNHLDPQ